MTGTRRILGEKRARLSRALLYVNSPAFPQVFLYRCKDASIPLGLAFGTVLQVLGIAAYAVPLTNTLGALAWLWAFALTVCCIAITVGVCLRSVSKSKSVSLEYGGLLTASFCTLLWTFALILTYPFLTVMTSVGYSFGVGMYFFFRWLILHYALREASRKPNDPSEG